MPKTAVLKQTVPPYFPTETPLTRIVYEDGESAYFSPYDYEVNVYGVDLELFLICRIHELKAAVLLLEDEDYMKFGQVFETILHAFENQVHEVAHVLYRHVGDVSLDLVGKNKADWRDGRVVWAEIIPCDKEEEAPNDK